MRTPRSDRKEEVGEEMQLKRQQEEKEFFCTRPESDKEAKGSSDFAFLQTEPYQTGGITISCMSSGSDESSGQPFDH